MLRRVNCLSWIPTALPCGQNLPKRTANVWPNWIALSGARVWTPSASARRKVLPSRCNIFLRQGEVVEEDEVRRPKSEKGDRSDRSDRSDPTDHLFRISAFGLLSAFGFRPSGFCARLSHSILPARSHQLRSRHHPSPSPAAWRNSAYILGTDRKSTR